MIRSMGLARTVWGRGIGVRPFRPARNMHWSRLVLNSQKEAGVRQARPSIKELTKKYGWTAAGVYLALSAIDLPLCFIAVHSLGQERVKELEKTVKGWIGMNTDDLATESEEGAEKKDDSNWSTLLTEFGIAYAIHKSVFFFVRVPAAAAITPWAAKTLQRWGFNVGKKGATTTAGKFGTSPSKRQKWTSWFF